MPVVETVAMAVLEAMIETVPSIDIVPVPAIPVALAAIDAPVASAEADATFVSKLDDVLHIELETLVEAVPA